MKSSHSETSSYKQSINNITLKIMKFEFNRAFFRVWVDPLETVSSHGKMVTAHPMDFVTKVDFHGKADPGFEVPGPPTNGLNFGRVLFVN